MAGSTTARDRAWKKMREFARAGRDFTPAAIAKGLRGTEQGNIARYMAGLAEAGVLEVTARARGKAAAYGLARDLGPDTPILKVDGGGLAPRRVGHHGRSLSQRARIWQAARAFGQRRRSFTAMDLLIRIDEAQSTSGLATIRTYLWALAESGFLIRVHDGPVRRYRVARDDGPKHPVPRKDCVFDPNTGIEHRREVSA